MITKSGHSTIDETKEASYLDDISIIPQLEADLFRFKNVSWSFKGNNSIAIEGYGSVPYNQVISVRIAGSFTFNNQRYAKGTVLQMPAIQVALMSHVNTIEVSSKATWMVVDLGTLAVGIGGAKILFTTGNYIRKAVVAADLVGSTAGLVVQTLNNDAISDELRSKIQIAGFLSTLPNVMASLPRINKVVDELDAIIETRTGVKGVLSEQELAEVQNIRNSLNSAVRNTGVLDGDFAADAAEIGRRVVTLGSGDVNSVKEWLGAIRDGKFYVVAHGEGNVFKVIHNGEEVTLSHRSLAQWIKSKNIPNNQSIVLLSCNDVNTAQNLVNKLGRSVIANDGWVKVYDNGFIQGEKKFRLLTPQGNPATAAEATAIGKQGVSAGTKAVKLQGGWTGFIDELNWEASLKEALKADIVDKEDLRLLFMNAANRDELATAWKAVSKHEVRLNVEFIQKQSSLPSEQRIAISKFYDNMAAPAGFKGRVDYVATKTVNGTVIQVKYDKYGFPEFESFSAGQSTFIKSDKLTGIYEHDNAIANEALIKRLGEENVWVNPAGNGSPVSIKIDGKWQEFTWHHYQDGKTMMPVLKDVHNAFNHSGGKQAIESGLKGVFSY